jgi:hypothetical protein
MNAGGNRSGTRFTPRMADAATQTYLYGSSDPTPWKANHRMGAAGGGLRDSHLLRGGARETYQRVAGIYERTGDDTVTVEFTVFSDDGLVSNVRIESDDHGDDHDLYDQGDGDHGDDQGNSAHGYSDEDPGYDQVP